MTIFLTVPIKQAPAPQTPVLEIQVYDHRPCIVKSQVKPLLSCRSLVDTHNHGVITLKGLKRQLLLGLDAHLPQLGDFLGKDGFGRGGRVDTVGLDGDDNTTANLEEEASYKKVSRVAETV